MVTGEQGLGLRLMGERVTLTTCNWAVLTRPVRGDAGKSVGLSDQRGPSRRVADLMISL